MAVLVPCLVQLRADVDAIAPGRDRSSDGTIGDRAHQDRVSDHNDDETGRVPIRDADTKHEVHALDLDVNLREPGLTMEAVVQHVVGRCRSGAERRLRYVIYNERIWEASNGWRRRSYSGDNPHTQHAHFSASYDSRHEASTASWHLEEIPVALTDADKKWLSATINTAVAAELRGWTEENPDSTKTPRERGRVGGWIRMSEQRARVRHEQLLAAIEQAVRN
ncbi:hypothetical protein [Actinoplanes sp. NPDC049802]|uniref:hypothetical protein n=1 Tax=Actinoplanes sp. NPDC049802 TaxID=3154742 RepID=UPI0033FD5F52